MLAPHFHDVVHPNGVPEELLDPRYHQELRTAKLLLERTAAIVVAARRSTKRSTIIFENPADRCREGCYVL